ncbi:MAG: glycosyltransferase family 4 protein, partial [Parvularculaceae bacterium]|nr:glycosyltransferase family 4 protein [Parvularculaceae bacterium]
VRVGLVSPSWPASQASNGIVTYTDVMAKALAREGAHVTVIAQNLTEPGSAGDSVYAAEGEQTLVARVGDFMRYRVMRRRWPDPRKMAANVAKAVRSLPIEHSVDVVEVEEAFGYARHLAQLIPQPVIVRLHGPHFLGAFGALDADDGARMAVEGAAIRDAIAVTSPSPGLLAATVKQYGRAGQVNAVIPNPVEMHSSRWRLSNCDRNTILFVGRFDLRKGGDVIIEAFTHLAASRPQLRLVMVGPDTGVARADGSGVDRFESFVAAHVDAAVAARIEFRGRVPLGEVAKLRQTALVAVGASRFENFSYAQFESLAFGAPTVLTRTFGPSEILQDGEGGLFVPPGDAEALAKAIAALIDDPDKAADLGERGPGAVARVCGPANVARSTLKFYASVLAEEAFQPIERNAATVG